MHITDLIPVCENCHNRGSVRLRRMITASGVTVMMWRCLACDSYAQKYKPYVQIALVRGWISSGILKVSSVEDIPLYEDRHGTHLCEVCGAGYAALHHWMPQVFRGVVENLGDWPTSYLCKDCHNLWHEVVTFYIPGRGASEISKVAQRKVGRIK